MVVVLEIAHCVNVFNFVSPCVCTTLVCAGICVSVP